MLRKFAAAAAIIIVALLSLACARANTTPAVKPTPTPDPKAQVITFLKALDKVDKQKDAWAKEYSTFFGYSFGMTPMARREKYQELLTNFIVIKYSVMDVERPPIETARKLHDAYVTQASKMSQFYTLLQPSMGQGIQADNATSVRIQGLGDELMLAETQLKETRQDLIRQFSITPSDLVQ